MACARGVRPARERPSAQERDPGNGPAPGLPVLGAPAAPARPVEHGASRCSAQAEPSSAGTAGGARGPGRCPRACPGRASRPAACLVAPLRQRPARGCRAPCASCASPAPAAWRQGGRQEREHAAVHQRPAAGRIAAPGVASPSRPAIRPATAFLRARLAPGAPAVASERSRQSAQSRPRARGAGGTTGLSVSRRAGPVFPMPCAEPGETQASPAGPGRSPGPGGSIARPWPSGPRRARTFSR